MKTTLVLLVILAGAGAAAFGLSELGGGAERPPARAVASAPLDFALKPAHGSGVSGTVRLTPAGADLKVTVTLSKRVPGHLFAHIHTGPCSKEPTLRNPRIWASLDDVADGRSETTVNVVTLEELRSESSSLNVHDPTHANRPLVCGDIPPAP